MPTHVRLDPTDAEFVDVIHTDGKSIFLLGNYKHALGYVKGSGIEWLVIVYLLNITKFKLDRTSKLDSIPSSKLNRTNHIRIYVLCKYCKRWLAPCIISIIVSIGDVD